MNVPGWWEFVLLGLAAFRVWRLVAEDLIFEPLRARLLATDSTAEEFVTCPWCSGFWVALGWWAAWEVWPHATVVIAVPFALSAIVGLVAANLDPE